MVPHPRSLAVAAVSGLLGVLGLVATSRELQHISAVAAEDPEGLVTGFAAAFALLFLVSSLLALGEAGTLAAAVVWGQPPAWARRLLVAGATTGGLATLPRAVLTLAFVDQRQLFIWTITESSIPLPPLLGAWWVLAALGVFGTGVGVLLYVVGPLTRRQEHWIQAGIGAVLLAVAGAAALELTGGQPPVTVGMIGIGLLVAGGLCAGLGGLLYTLQAVNESPPGEQLLLVLLPALGLLGLVAAVFQILIGRPILAALIGLVSLGMLVSAWVVGSRDD